MFNKKKQFLIIVLLFFVGLIAIGYNLSNLQKGLETPQESAFKSDPNRVNLTKNYKPITSFESFLVPVEDNISVKVYSRENEKAIENIFMVHGAGSGPYAWEIYFNLFPEKYNLYALSWRGHQGCDPVNDASIYDYIKDQKAVMDEVTHRSSLPVHVIGHSYGGATSVMLEAQSEVKIKSLHLIAPIVPLNYSKIQEFFVPLIAPYFIRKSEGKGNNPFGTYGEMFIAKERMLYYYEKYAKQEFSVEKPSVIAGDGISVKWQKELDKSYIEIGREAIPIWFLVARYDNVVVPQRQRNISKKIGAEAILLESGHYIPLDAQAEKSANLIINNLTTLEIIDHDY